MGVDSKIDSKIDCNDIFNELNYAKISSSIQELLSTDLINEDKEKQLKPAETRVFEMKSMNKMDNEHDAKMEIADISDLCVLATKQMQLLQDEKNENMIQIKKLNLIHTLNKIKASDITIY